VKENEKKRETKSNSKTKIKRDFYEKFVAWMKHAIREKIRERRLYFAILRLLP